MYFETKTRLKFHSLFRLTNYLLPQTVQRLNKSENETYKQQNRNERLCDSRYKHEMVHRVTYLLVVSFAQ